MIKDGIVIIGAGKLAYSLTSALLDAGYSVQSVISRKLSSAKSLAKKFSIPHFSNSIHKIPANVKIYFITVPDGEIKKVAESLSKLKKNFTDCICIHFSGVENISALQSLHKKGCEVGSLHIIRPFPSKNVVDINNFPASIETESKRANSYLIQLCKKLKLKPHRIKSDEKILHHLAAVHSSNFLVGNLFSAFHLIDSKNNLPKEILKQTTQTALDNVFKLGPAKALSGPIDRGDIYAIKKHIAALDKQIRCAKKNKKLKLLKKSYVVQSLLLLEVVKEKYGKLDKNHLKIKKFLESNID
ncbi:MAG: DUF2520 domain-containing protein [Ignavibacteriaceae bacterium]|nr:DUF2520 domain-containing protein [Ignavibacteriaceae bacterium]MCW8812914.1 DUF2520 domain-containing protein [Chlorobium sp.]MCW8824008.1 DUF2520 domain-containing protein [Ignavibacteriaceae bacterium]MCW8962101.1 DUF2520 domain-containing protein [Ignavibacteriaceae bacterium]MCW9094402.1 DUF2520 domain-containing protein [Ignavibacteriaceae bacterium]